MMLDYLKLVSEDKKNNISANVLGCEKDFSLQLTENIVLNGCIDRIQLDPDGILHIADYKTSKDKKYLKEDWFQLLTYAFIMYQDDPTLDKIRGSYIMLRHNFEYITKEFNKDEIIEVGSKYIDYATKMQNELDFSANPTALCNYCSFLEHCDEGKKKINYISNITGEVDW